MLSFLCKFKLFNWYDIMDRVKRQRLPGFNRNHILKNALLPFLRSSLSDKPQSLTVALNQKWRANWNPWWERNRICEECYWRLRFRNQPYEEPMIYIYLNVAHIWDHIDPMHDCTQKCPKSFNRTNLCAFGRLSSFGTNWMIFLDNQFVIIFA